MIFVRHAARHLHALMRHVAEADGVVRPGEDGLREVLANLFLVDVDGRHEIDVAHVVAAEVDVHQARDELVLFGLLVKVPSLDQGRGAVPHAHDGDVDLPLRLLRRAAHPYCALLPLCRHPFLLSLEQVRFRQTQDRADRLHEPAAGYFRPGLHLGEVALAHAIPLPPQLRQEPALLLAALLEDLEQPGSNHLYLILPIG
jgi:hypothetical protein